MHVENYNYTNVPRIVNETFKVGFNLTKSFNRSFSLWHFHALVIAILVLGIIGILMFCIYLRSS